MAIMYLKYLCSATTGVGLIDAAANAIQAAIGGVIFVPLSYTAARFKRYSE